MKKIIKISDTHYIIVDDSGVKGADFGWDVYEKKIFHATLNWKGQTKNRYFKITHSTPVGGLSALLESGVKQIPLSEVEETIYGYSVEKMAEQETVKNKFNSEKSYIKGFKAHQELVKDKLFTEINRQIFDFTHDLKESTSDFIKQNCEGAIFGLKRLKQSLLPKTEWNIEFDEQGKIKLS